jgi:primosomal protein N' (replication factor Y)
MSRFLADIALPVPLEREFTYLVPPELQHLAQPGARALVPFGRKHLTGVIVRLPAETTVTGLRPVRDILDAAPTYSAEMLRLTQWIAEYYFAPWGEVLKVAAPHGSARDSRRIVRLLADDVGSILSTLKPSASRQRAILQELQRAGALSVPQLQRRTRTKSIHAVLHGMAARGWVEVADIVEQPTAKPKYESVAHPTAEPASSPALTGKQSELLESLRGLHTSEGAGVPVTQLLKHTGYSLSILNSLVKKGAVRLERKEVLRAPEYVPDEPTPSITLNSHQTEALEHISQAITAGTYTTFLLHGVTGSGKTQVYIEAIKRAISFGRTAIVMVPEISLTPQTVRRFKVHFGDRVAVMHSQLSAGERFDAWRLAHDGRVNIVIGPRSAIFAPLKNVGLIVVDEEQEASYKQFDASPRYHARDVAIVRATFANAVVVLGSATPSVESYYNALKGKYRMLELPERADRARMPRIEIVDMIKERRRVFEDVKKETKESGKPFPKRLPPTTISGLMREEIAARIQKREGTILLQNRRGFSHVVECFDCGYVEKCDNCEVTLTYHVTKKHLRCHYCGFVKKPPTVCPKCGSIEIRFHAFGTQQVHEELRSLFPNATILRMDLDTTSRKGAHDRMLQQFGRGDADILLGTQMVAKGLDFPRVTLVGVVSADTQMLLPDFRASERTFQLLTQVAGRAGRAQLAGEVIIQTLQPGHYSLNHVLQHDFAGFYNEELTYRKELDYPPFSRIVLLEFKGERENEVQHHAKKFAEYLSQLSAESHSIVLGPADAAIPKIKKLFRKHIILKNLKSHDPAGQQLRSTLRKAQSLYAASPLARNKRVQMAIDVDPQGMM